MKKSWIRILAVAMALGLLAGCGSSGTKSEGQPAQQTTPAPKKTAAVAAMSGDAVSLDPHDTNDNLSYGIENAIYEGLVGFDKDMKVIPVLAESYQVSDDAMTFTFHLRKGIKFHTGEPVNAAAVKKSFDRVRDPKSKLKRNSLFAPITSIETADDATVVFKLTQPFGAMLYNFAHPAGKVIAPSGVDKGKDELARNPKYGTGPYMFKEWVQNDHITVVKNPDYWNKDEKVAGLPAPKVDSITFKPIAESGTRVNGLKAGDLDFVLPLPPVDAQALKSDAKVKVNVAPSIYVYYMAMNVSKKPFNDIRVRQALNLAIDREALRKGLLRGFADPVTSYLAPNVAFYAKQGDEIKRDVDKAKQLLKDAGYDGTEVELWHGNATERKDLAAALIQQMAEIGFKVKSVPMDNAALSSNLWNQDEKSNKVQLYVGGWSTSTGDADWAIRPLLDGASAPPNGYNVGFYNNPKVNDLIKAGLATADPAKRAPVYAQLQQVLWQDMPWVPLYSSQNIWGTGANVDGAYVQGDGIVNYNGINFK